jgi:outer membrane autotransporter protein
LTLTANVGGATTQTLNGACTYTGATTIDGGILQIGNSGSLDSSTGGIAINAGQLTLFGSDQINDNTNITLADNAAAIFDLNAQDETIGQLTGGGGAGGNVDLNSGTLTVSATGGDFGGSLLAGGGTLDVNGAITQTLSGDNSAFGGTLQASGGGTIIATTANSLTAGTGGVTLDNGTLQTGGAFGNTTVVNIAAGGGTIDTTGGALTQNANITGTGTLTVAGNSANALIAGGTIATETVNVGATGVLQLGAADRLADTATVTVDGAFNLSGNDETIGDLAGGGTVDVADNTLTIAAAASDYTGTFAATATRAGVIDVTGGDLTLSGNSNAFDGTLSVTGGRVDVDGTLGDGTAAFTVANGATAGGAGTWAGTLTVNAGGIVAPGNSIGNMTVATYAPAAGSFLDIEVAGGGGNGAPNNDQLIVTTAANLNDNGTVRAILTQAIGNYTVGDTWTILDATAGGGGALAGEFAGVTGALGTWSLVYPGDETVDLVLLNVAPSYQALGTTGNQQSVGAALDNIGLGTATGDLQTVFTALNGLPASQIPAALDEITPTNNLQVAQLQLASSRAMTSSLRQHLGVARTRPSGSGNIAARPAPQPKLLEGMGPDLAFYGSSEDAMALGQNSTPPAGETACGAWGLWFRNQSTWGDQEDTAQADGYDFFTNDFTLGGDREWLPGLRAGLMLGYSHTNLDLNNRAGDAELDSLRMAAYGTYSQAGFYLDAAMGFGWNWYENNRNINWIGRKAKSDHDGQEYMAFLGGGYDWTFDRFTVGPTASLQYVHIREDGYSESGAGALNLKVDSSDADFLRQTVGLRAQYDWDLDWFRLTPELRAEWVHEYLTDARSLGATLGYPGGAFRVDGSNIPSDAVNLNAGMRMDFRNGFTGHLFYEYYKECGDGTDAHTLSAGLRYEF